jgi:hypothetical protein
MKNIWSGLLMLVVFSCLVSFTLAEEEEAVKGDILLGGWQEIPLSKRSSYFDGLAFLLK